MLRVRGGEIEKIVLRIYAVRGKHAKQDEFKRRFRHIPEIIMNKGELDIADLEIAEDYVEHIPMPPQFPTNRQGFKDFVMMLRTAFPDLHYDVDHLTTNDLIGENQKVVHRIVAHATHDGPWGPIPPTRQENDLDGDSYRAVCRRQAGRTLGQYQYARHHAADGRYPRLV